MSPLPLTLFGITDPSVTPLAPTERIELDECCWADHTPGFLHGADTLLVELEERMNWYRGKRLMYGTWHDEPRLTGTEPAEGCDLPPVIDEVRAALSLRYDRAFHGLFCNFYQNGQDSVAWHADRIGRTDVDPLVAILSLGGPRQFMMRPQSGGASVRILLASGDLLIMGGATQHHWEHAVPKTKHAPPRISVTMRAGGPRLTLGV